MKLHTRMSHRLLASLALVAVMAAGCGDVIRSGKSPVLIVIDSFKGAPGGGFGANTFSDTLRSDVIVSVTSPAPCTPTSPCPTIFDDFGRVTMHLESKDLAIQPTSNNQVTITRYHVTYRRADGRNTPGVDVPYGFDGAVTGTIPPTGALAIDVELVRHVAKDEPPLAQLRVSPNIINTIAELTLYGTDLVGTAITATASISIEFGNFGDQ
jgi:hypothetical protein